jgi:tetratricopeptide (TPR) repeat protein
MLPIVVSLLFWQAPAAETARLQQARDAQNRPALERMASDFSAVSVKQPNDAAALYRYALAESYVAEVATETGDKNGARKAAEAGITAAEKLTSLQGSNAEYHRLWGTLCGQAIPANVLLALRYGKCAQDEVNKAIELAPKAAENYVSRGVGNYYLPASFGGGAEVAIKDFQKAVELDPRSADAHLWLGLALRKANRNAEARKEMQRSLELDPARVWAKQQLAKTPEK